ncbi:D-glycero-beta-D-manno-heptose 1,7-bisphosphate 7-phosphatase [Paenalcaligenes sp.]|uniref:D-glycero-beta-D-manno-heptose 1,7-bisphosphate 7-phosphatase n=1 Tax=Paenalcaligenes sp. TaxID=1966342 RepID=UPI002633C796|nr:D-glycero-beta-D-manno-heptose 1,7-bisphosphate 7-phosphatase [Paenalcaligenes sp.]
MKTAILDRDGVINYDSKAFIKSPDEWVAIPGSLEAIAKLKQAGWRVIIATNQSGLARGLFNMDTLNAIHLKMRQQLAAFGAHVDAIFICPHGPDDHCTCRKPLPGMFIEAMRRYDLNPENCVAVGDSLRDLQAAHAAQISTALVLTGNGAQTQQQPLPPLTTTHPDLAAVVQFWLAQS